MNKIYFLIKAEQEMQKISLIRSVKNKFYRNKNKFLSKVKNLNIMKTS